MKKQTNPNIKAHLLRSAFYLLLAVCLIPFSWAINLSNHPRKFTIPQNNTAASAIQRNRTLTFADRVAYQRAIEDVYWQHRIWPKENAGPKPPLDKVMSQADIEKKVEDYVRNSQALEDYWQKPITPDQLQAEMERIASHTKQPGVLREIFAALGNDPFVIAECLARPVLAERLVSELNNEDGVKLTKIAWRKQQLQSRFTTSEPQVFVTMAAVSANYTLPTISDLPDTCTDDTWTATSLTNAPDGRYGHTAVWTGSEMIVWGGSTTNGFLPTGGRYNPATDSWTLTSITNAPTGRVNHTAVWTGSEMIVWGGFDGSYSNTGGRYNPSTDSWTATNTTNAPTGRFEHTAVWSGSEMIVWGGFDSLGALLNTGGRYSPVSDSWTATSTTNAPTGRGYHTAVWTGTQMIVWGGYDGSYPNTGGRYSPVSDTWTATSTTNAPSGRYVHTAVWTGSEMIVWGGGFLDTGGRYNPSTDSWTATSTTNAPTGRGYHTAVWTGTQMIVWGGSDGSSSLNTGGRYSPVSDSWTATSTTNAPTGRYEHTAVWTGNQVIVWGGYDGSSNYLNTGGRYCAQPPPPTLGDYPDTSIALSTDTSVTPDAAPTNVTSINVSTSTNFDGTLEGDPATGVVRVTDAHPAGTYSVTVTAFDSGGATASKTFTLTVTTSATCTPVSFAPATNFGASGPASVAVGDFNGDGKQDLAVVSAFSNNVSIFLGDGAGNFSAASNFGVGNNPQSVAVGDFNGDGKQDLAVTNNGTVSILLGDGAGNFNAATSLGVAAGGWVAVGDFNGDGRQDLAVVNFQYVGSVSILLGNGDGSFQLAVNFGAGTYSRSVAVGDFNGDGKQDLAVANYNSDNVSILLGDGAGNFSAATNFGTGGYPSSVAVGDFNGDGKQDLAVANSEYPGNVSILLGDGAGNFSAATNFDAGSEPSSVAVGDFNGDGKQDLAVANENAGPVSILLGDGTGNFSTPINFYAGTYYPFFLAVGDFNGDGKQDLAVTDIVSNNMSILLRDCDQPPTADAGGPYTGTAGQAIQFDGSGSSDPDGSIVDYAWAFGDGGTGSGVQPTHTYQSAGTYVATLTVTDNLGATGTNTATVTVTEPPPIQVRVQTNPAGRSFTVDGTTYTAAHRFSWVPGSSHAIATTSPQSGGTGVQYVWARWSDNGAISHTVAPTTNTTYTATFRTQYFLTMTAGTGGRVSPPSGWKNSGASVSISARPANGFSFSNWTGTGTGSYSGTNNPASITMGGPVTENATFIHN